MSQQVWDEIDDEEVDGSELATILNNFKNAIMSGLSGPSRPTEIQQGGMWVDDTDLVAEDLLTLKMFDGEDFDIPLLRVNIATNTVELFGAAQQLTATSNDASGPILHFYKSRTGEQTLSGDSLGSSEFNGVDENDDVVTVARVRTIAAENTTSAGHGAQMIFESVKIGAATITEWMRFDGSKLNLPITTKISGIELDQQETATTGTPITALNTDKVIQKFTGSTATTIQGIDATGNSRSLLINNKSTAVITLKHQDAGATANNRMILPNGTDIILNADESIEFFYDTVSSRWRLQSGSGGGGGKYSVATAQTGIAASGTITISAVLARQALTVSGQNGGSVLSTTPFGAFGGTQPVELLILGDDNDNPVIIPYNDATNGCVGNFGAAEDGLEVRKDLPAKAFWNPATNRFYVQRGV